MDVGGAGWRTRRLKLKRMTWRWNCMLSGKLRGSCGGQAEHAAS